MTLYLPRTTETVSEAPLEERRSPAELYRQGEDRGCVLLVEDNADVSEVTRSQLEEFGFAVTHAPDVASARELLRQGDRAIDLVFSDIVMPGELNGLDLARTIRQEHGTRVPVLLATGYSDVAQVAADEGFPVLRKPYSTQQLRDALHRALRATRLKVVV